MGSLIEINDTLQLSEEQGFPGELDYQRHKIKPYKAEDFKDKVFIFKNKENIRVYQSPPVRNFLAQNVKGSWIYWGTIHIIEVTHNYINKTTSGKFKINYIYTPEEMAIAKKIIEGK